MKNLELQAADIGEMIHEKAVYKIFIQSISRKRGDTQSRGRWKMRAF
jgi:hypothetical protein